MYSPTNTPTKKRIIRDITNHHDVNNQLLTPTKTPTKKRKLSINDTHKPSCVKKLDFSNFAHSTTKPTLTPTSSYTTTQNVYSTAKALFQRGTVESINTNYELIGREEEANYINQFLTSNIQHNQCDSLYISGPPGTGKTAQLNLTLSQYTNDDNIKIININCMTLNHPDQIFHEIYCQMIDKLSISYIKKKTYDDFVHYLNNEFGFTHIILILDELDSLITKDQQVLFKLFQISNNNTNITKSKISFIGISNTLDLSNKFLPNLIKNNLLPKTLQFLPYNFEQIKKIIEHKLSSLKPLFHPMALQFCCRKSASISGDLRKSFDIIYKCIELIEKDELEMVQLNHVAKICIDSFSNNPLNDLNLLQKAILIQLCNYNQQKQDINHTVTVKALYDYYKKQDNCKILGFVKYSEFIEILNALESSSCITISNGTVKNKRNGSGIGNGDMKWIKINVKTEDVYKCGETDDILKKLIT